MEGSTKATREYKRHEKLAGRLPRLGAKLVDTLIVIVGLTLENYLSRYLGLGAVTGMIALALGVGYMLFADALPNGQSLGKKLFGICVIDERSYLNCNIYQAFIRNLPLQFLSILDWMFIFTGSRKRLGDMFASTIVIKSA